MRLEQLYCFVEAANCGSMASAAARLFISQQNISKSIKQLEEELGVVLFTRSNHGIFLTDEGRRIYETAQEITSKAAWLSEHYSAKTHPADDVCGTLQIVAHMSMTSFLIPVLEKLHLLYPSLKVAVSMQFVTHPPAENGADGDTVYLVCALAEDTVRWQPISQFAQVYLFRQEPLKVCLNVYSPFIKQQSISLRTLAEQPFIDHAGTLERPSFAVELFARYGYKPNIIFSCSTTQLTLEYIARHNAYCLGTNDISNAQSSCHHPSVLLKPLKEHIVMNYLLLIANKQRQSPAVQAFWQVFTESVQSGYTKLSF